jgi:hypothetical protein
MSHSVIIIGKLSDIQAASATMTAVETRQADGYSGVDYEGDNFVSRKATWDDAFSAWQDACDALTAAGETMSVYAPDPDE